MSKNRSPKVAPVWALRASLLLVAWGALVTLPAGFGSTPPDRGTPRLVLFDHARHFGAVSQGTVLRAEFRVRNAGSRRLVLAQIPATCCGGSDEAPPAILSPGQPARLSVRLDTAGLEGPLQRNVSYTTNDPAVPCLTLQLTAVVQP